MKNPDYAAQLMESMQAGNAGPEYIANYFRELITEFQRDAEAGCLTPERLLTALAHDCEVTSRLFNPNNLSK